METMNCSVFHLIHEVLIFMEIYEIFILISETFIKNLGLLYALFVRHSDNMIIECLL